LDFASVLLFVSLVSLPHTHIHTHTHARTHIDMNPYILKMPAFFVCLQMSCLSPHTDNCFKLKLSLCSKVYFHLINNSDVTNVITIITMNKIH